jgi:hypothetical protein
LAAGCPFEDLEGPCIFKVFQGFSSLRQNCGLSINMGSPLQIADSPEEVSCYNPNKFVVVCQFLLQSVTEGVSNVPYCIVFFDKDAVQPAKH